MTLSELIAALRTDLGDPEGTLFSEATLTRCLLRATILVGHDTNQVMTLTDGEIVPVPDELTTELLLLLAASYACSAMRSQTANAVNISSGDKRIERSTQAKHWGELADDWLARYRQRIADMTGGDDYLTPPSLRPVIYEQGSNL